MNNETIEQLAARAHQVLQALTNHPLCVRVSIHSGFGINGVEAPIYMVGVSSTLPDDTTEYQSFCGADFEREIASASEYVQGTRDAEAAKLKKIEEQAQSLGYKLVKEDAA